MKIKSWPPPAVGKKRQAFWWWVQLVIFVLVSIFFWAYIWRYRFYL